MSKCKTMHLFEYVWIYSTWIISYHLWMYQRRSVHRMKKSFNIKMHIICYRMKKKLKEKSKILKLIAKQEIKLDTKHFLSAKKERQQASKVLYTFSRQFSKLFSAIFDKTNWKNGRILRILQIYWIWASTRIKISFCNS